MNKRGSRKQNPEFKFRVNQSDLEAARAAFFDPENHDAELEQFYILLQNMADGDRGFVSRKNPQAMQAIQRIFEHLKKAQRFDKFYLGHMLTEASIPAMLAYILAIRSGSNTVAREVSEVESALEPEAIGWLAELVGFDKKSASGTFTSGGSLANLTALWVARELASEKAERERLTTTERPNNEFVVIANPFIHYSITKAVRILAGPNGSISVLKAPSRNLQMDPAGLEAMIREITDSGKKIMAIVAIAGETETGIVDPLNAIADIAKKYHIYLHVDAAYGFAYLMSTQKHLFKGIQRANSVTLDPHKTLNTPYEAGAVVFRDPHEHAKIKFDSDDAAYVFKPGQVSLGQKRIEGSAGAGCVLATVAAINAFSKQEWQALLDHTLNNTGYLYRRLLASPILQPLHKPHLNVVCFTIRPEYCRRHGITHNSQLEPIIELTRQQLRDQSGYFFSATNLSVDESVDALSPAERQQWTYRAVLMHPRTEPTHIEEAITLLEQLIESATNR